MRKSAQLNSARPASTGDSRLLTPVFHGRKITPNFFQGECPGNLAKIPEACVDLIFADPLYFLEPSLHINSPNSFHFI
jgi:hypothetical protein